ncbi:hypothetical protein KLF37_06180 [Clostridium perfringens]|uniref:hypothetical protein n=1 Tax=Clostridium perfringens TaxID=1502 RepID=UPI001CCD3CB8|nr:hypothetical protein [Clostridium perfringens]EGT0692911.1 hypothetical protein [Clostridium perfringens]EIF6167625.1 hypothetical protein [Clostridium perfringens]MDH5068719.1 hypothetical protein [Clostridium perfringens]MDH5088856.1 hypothetical protein [Clostridium perfringens]MDM0635108.1 hypothetical protein [Clostridium perfringens]
MIKELDFDIFKEKLREGWMFGDIIFKLVEEMPKFAPKTVQKECNCWSCRITNTIYFTECEENFNFIIMLRNFYCFNESKKKLHNEGKFEKYLNELVDGFKIDKMNF